MSKKHLRHVWHTLKPINSWFFFAGFVVFLLIGIYAVRQNNVRSIELRDAVIAADEANGDVETALNNLRQHIYSHMNAGLSSGNLQQPIQLKYRYERLVAAQQKSSNGQDVYGAAQAYCEALYPAGSLREGRVPCIEKYVTEHSSNGSNPTIPDSLYKFDFVSPRWSPDLAGWSLLLSGIFLSLFLIRFLTERWFRAELKADL